MLDQEMHRWYVVYSKPHKEELAQFHLRLKGLETFFPRLLLPEPLVKRRRIVPLFPNYLFVRIHVSEEYHFALWSPGVKYIVSFNGTPAPLDEEVIAILRHRANPEGVLTAHSGLTAGQECRLAGGLFKGLAGIIQDPPDAKGRVWVLMKLLSRQVRVKVPLHFIEERWVAGDGHRIASSAG